MRGFVEAASGRWEEAIALMERFIKYNPNADFGYLMIAMLYAQMDRLHDARGMLDKGTAGWPAEKKNVRYIMSLLNLGNLQTAQLIAKGYIKAGLPGQPTGYYKLSKENILTEKEIRKLFFGRQVAGFIPTTRNMWRTERSHDGKATIFEDDRSDTGQSWIEEGMLCDKWDTLHEGLEDCWIIYHNPDGSEEKKDEFIGAPGYGIYPFSVEK